MIKIRSNLIGGAWLYLSGECFISGRENWELRESSLKHKRSSEGKKKKNWNEKWWTRAAVFPYYPKREHARTMSESFTSSSSLAPARCYYLPFVAPCQILRGRRSFCNLNSFMNAPRILFDSPKKKPAAHVYAFLFPSATNWFAARSCRCIIRKHNQCTGGRSDAWKKRLLRMPNVLLI